MPRGQSIWPAPNRRKRSRVFPLGTPYVRTNADKKLALANFLLCWMCYHIPTCAEKHRRKLGSFCSEFCLWKWWREQSHAISSSYAPRRFDINGLQEWWKHFFGGAINRNLSVSWQWWDYTPMCFAHRGIIIGSTNSGLIYNCLKIHMKVPKC